MEVRGVAALKEPMTYAGLRFEHWSWDLSHEAKVEPSGLDWSLLAGDGASWQRSQPQGWNWSLEAGIGASRLGLEPQGWDRDLSLGLKLETDIAV